MIQVIVDSNIDMPPDWLERYHIISLPYNIILEGKEYQDGINLDRADMFAAMARGIIPKTSQVPQSVIYKTFKEQLEQGKDIIALFFSSEMSGTYQTAEIVTEMLQEDYPDRRIALIDSRGGSFGPGLVAAHMAQMAEDDADLDAIVAQGKRELAATHYLFTITNLDWMARGGRISKTMGYIGDKMQIKPVLTIVDGKIIVCKKIHGTKKADQYLVDQLVKGYRKNPGQELAVAHSNDLQRAERLKAMIQQKIPEAKITISEISSVVAVHLGSGGVGVFWRDA